MDKKKVLIVDDEEELCLLVKHNLEHTGEFKVSTAFSGKEGIEAVKKTDFDLVITDFKMPDMDGEQVLNVIKKSNPELPVILFSIYHDDCASIDASVKNKADGLICKPIDQKQLYKVIKDALAK